MVPMFVAFDHPNHHELLSRYVANLLQAPPEIVEALSEGGFTTLYPDMAWLQNGCQEAPKAL